MKPWRLAGALTLSAAAAIAFVAANRSSPPSVGKSGGKARAVGKFRDDADKFRNKMTMPGPEQEGGPMAAAEEDYANRAFPATYIPFKLTTGAQKGWGRAKSWKHKNKAGTWTLIGPSSANFPDVLTFSGAPYTTSGRVTALAISPNCGQGHCYLYLAAAGGGIWRTDKALHTNPSQKWEFISGSFATNAIGTLVIDPSDPTGKTLYAGTGEPNASADSEAGFGIYKSTNGGNSWTHLAANTSVPTGAGVDCGAPFGVQNAPAYSGPAFDGRAISSIVLDGSTMYVGSTRAVRGISSVSSGGAVTLAPGLPPYGLWKSTDGGANFTLLNYQDVCLNPTLAGSAGIIQSSFGSVRGVNDASLDPSTSSTVYAAAFQMGVWRSTNAGAAWTQIKAPLNAGLSTDRASFAVTKLGNGNTRMYVGVGNSSTTAANQARLYRTDDAVTATNASFTDLTAMQQASAAPNQTLNYCTGQCWYDNVVYSPPGKPDVVYLGGSYDYAQFGLRNNGRAFIRSMDGGVTFTDMTWDATTKPTPPNTCCQGNPIAPNGQHPDSHAIVEVPGTDAAFFGTDGGLVRSSGSFTDISYQCSSYRGLTGTNLASCQQLLSQVPTKLYTTYNDGLSTLQFQSVSVDPSNVKHLMGGTQDNGTFQTTGSTTVWPQVIYGDGGQSGFSASNGALRFNTFTGQANDVNFRNGDPLKWVIASGPIINSPEGSQFYPPVIADPHHARGGTIFQGSQSIWRTQDWAGGQAYLEANCPEFTTSAANPACGDFVSIGAPNAIPSLGFILTFTGNVAAIARTTSDTGTLWAATTDGFVFISKNADDATPANVIFTQLDSLDPSSPKRFVSGIAIDPKNTNHAWISYSSYSSLTPATPGHVFSVTYDPVAGTATWTNLDGSGATAFPDFPATAIAHDWNGDLYVANDWGVLLLPHGSTDWEVAGTGLPMVEVAGLTIVPGSRKLFAATHGRSAWQLTLP